MKKKIEDLLPNKLNDFKLSDARKWFARGLEGGINCPCCGRFAKIYHRRIYGSMVAFLVQLTRIYMKTPKAVDIKQLDVRGGDYAKLLYWGLVRQIGEGSWIPTKKGAEFALGKIPLPKYVYLYNSRVLGFSEETVMVQESMGKFNYQELMYGNPERID